MKELIKAILEQELKEMAQDFGPKAVERVDHLLKDSLDLEVPVPKGNPLQAWHAYQREVARHILSRFQELSSLLIAEAEEGVLSRESLENIRNSHYKELERMLATEPALVEQYYQAGANWIQRVLVPEIQKAIPDFDGADDLISEYSVRFILALDDYKPNYFVTRTLEELDQLSKDMRTLTHNAILEAATYVGQEWVHSRGEEVGAHFPTLAKQLFQGIRP